MDSPEVSTAIARIEQETERLNGMVGKLLTLSRMEAGPQLVDKEEIELSNLLRQVVDDADFEARNRNCRVVLYETNVCHAVGSPELLYSAVDNIVRNAVRYTAEQTEVEVRLLCKANDAKSRLSLRFATMDLGYRSRLCNNCFALFSDSTSHGKGRPGARG